MVVLVRRCCISHRPGRLQPTSRVPRAPPTLTMIRVCLSNPRSQVGRQTAAGRSIPEIRFGFYQPTAGRLKVSAMGDVRMQRDAAAAGLPVGRTLCNARLGTRCRAVGCPRVADPISARRPFGWSGSSTSCQVSDVPRRLRYSFAILLLLTRGPYHSEPRAVLSLRDRRDDSGVYLALSREGDRESVTAGSRDPSPGHVAIGPREPAHNATTMPAWLRHLARVDRAELVVEVVTDVGHAAAAAEVVGPARRHRVLPESPAARGEGPER